MFNYDDFPVLASSMGHGSQETQVFKNFCIFFDINFRKVPPPQMSTTKLDVKMVQHPRKHQKMEE